MKKVARRSLVKLIFRTDKGIAIGGLLVALAGAGIVLIMHSAAAPKPERLAPTAARQAYTAAATRPPTKHPGSGQESDGSLAATKTGGVGVSPVPASPAPATTAGNQVSGGVPGAAGTVAPANRRAMWVWNSSSIVASASSENQLFDFAAARGVQTLYFYSEGLIDSDPAALRTFVTAAATHAIDVELLFGEPEWALAGGHAAAVGFMNKAVAFAGSLPAGSRPVGAHFDVEPASLPQWGSDPAGTAGQYLDMLDALRAAKGPLRLSVDTAMAYDYLTISRSGTSKELTKWIIDAADAVTLMSYRDYAAPPDGIIDHGEMSVAYAASAGKRVTLGVETTCGLAPQKITFCEEGNAVMEAELAKTKAYYSASAGFTGFAIHEYATYRALAP